MQIENYEGSDEIERAWREGLTPDPLLTVSEWADRHRILSSKASAEPGRWRTSRTPYLKAIMDCLPYVSGYFSPQLEPKNFDFSINVYLC